MLDDFSGEALLVSLNGRGQEAGLGAFCAGTTGPVLQDTSDNPLWAQLHGEFPNLLVVDRRALVAYTHKGLAMPSGEATLRAQLEELVVEGQPR